MKVYIKNKLFSLRGSSSVKDENKQDVFFVKGKLFSPTHKKLILSKEGKVLFTVRNKWFNMFNRYAYVCDENKNKIAKIKHGWFGGKRFTVEGYKDEIVVDGDFFSLKSSIRKNGEIVGTINREFAMLDAFCLEAKEEDIPFLIALVIAIDNIMDKVTK